MLLGNPRCIARTIIFSAILIAGIIRISEASSLLGTQFNGLFTIDDNTAEAGLVGNVQLGSDTLDLSTLEFGADGTLLGTAANGLYTIDPTTGIAGLIGNVQLGSDTLDLTTLAFGTDGTLFGTAANGLYTIDPATGIAGFIGNVQLGSDTLDLSTLATWPFVIDIKPNDDRNRVNLCAKSPLSVAILSSGAFDAPTEVDPATVQLAEAGVKTVGKDNRFSVQTRDVNGDGLTDLILKIVTEDLDLEPGVTEAELTGQTFGGTPIKAKDAVEVEERMCLRTL